MLSKPRSLIAVARGKLPADLILANARIVNTLTGQVETGNVAIYKDTIAGVGDYREASEVIDLSGRYLAPGLINGHTHLESSMLDIGQYARAVVPQGTLAVVTDLHEIANVAGLDGMRYVLNFARRLPLSIFLMAPSCVPASRFETSGATLNARDLDQVMAWPDCIGLGEVMNYPAVISGDAGVIAKINLAAGRTVDGHAPGLSGSDLNAYLAAGIMSDHESITLAEASEKLARGMHIMIREGSTEKNLATLLPLVNDRTYRRCMFVVDDRSCADLFRDGDIAAVVRKAIKLGLDPVRAIQMATINPAGYFRLAGLGAIGPGYLADMVVFDDLSRLDAGMVFHRGKLVSRQGEWLPPPQKPHGRGLTNTVNVRPFTADELRMPVREEFPVIEVVPGQIVTRKKVLKVKSGDGLVLADTRRDILKLVVVERHRATGNIGLGLVKGFGLKRGALASSIAHDSHNIIAVGVNDADIYAAVRAVEKTRGGLAAAAGGKVLASLALPVAGLLSEEPLASVVAQYEKLEATARELGGTLPSAFAALSFLALPVIPELRLTDLGLVDVIQFKLITK
ncbi:MAG: adenine deaminase [Chloroflexi bacterium]|nr:adenine deaminase [Chloroflexota bacterium]